MHRRFDTKREEGHRPAGGKIEDRGERERREREGGGGREITPLIQYL
jgi:hypothetical protein